MAPRTKCVFSVQWPDFGNDCFVEPIILLETKRFLRSTRQQTTQLLQLDDSIKWLKMEHVMDQNKICGLVLVCDLPRRLRRASFAIQIRRLAVAQVTVRAGVTIGNRNNDTDIAFGQEGQTVVVAKLEDDSLDFPPPATLNSMSSVLAFEKWDKIPD